MNKAHLTWLSVAVAVLAGTVAVRAQDVKAIVAKMPAADVKDDRELAAQLAKLGAPAVKELCGMLVPLDGAAAEDDSKARYAVLSLVRHTSRNGAEADRAMAAAGLAEAIESAKDAEVRTFLIEQLEWVARDEAVPTLAKLLTDPRLCAPAARALVVIGSSAAKSAIARALPGTDGATRVTLIQSAGGIRAAEAIPEIEKSAQASDERLRMAALWSLANVGAPSFFAAADAAPRSTELAASQIRAWCILCAQRLTEAGKYEQAAATCLAILKSSAGRDRVHHACAAIRVLAEIPGDRALPALISSAQSDEPQIRKTALEAALKSAAPEITAQFAALLKTAAGPVKIDLLNFLSLRNDKSATDAVLSALKDTDPAVRTAAAQAAVRLAGDAAIPALVQQLKSATGDEARAVAETLVRMKGDRGVVALAQALPEFPVEMQGTMIDVLAGRPTPAGRDAVLALATSTNAGVRSAALKAMEKLATEKDVPRLVELAMSTADAGDEAAALKAAGIAAAGLPAESRADAMLAALPKAQATKRAALLRGIGKAGGTKAIEAIKAELKSGDEKARDGAVRALAESSEPAAIEPLMTIARNAATPLNQHVLALRGVVQVVPRTTLDAGARVKVLADALAVARRPDEKRQVLGALGAEKTPAALDVAAPLLEDPALKAEAALAVVKIAVPMERGQKGLSGPRVVEALKKAIPLCPDARAKGEAQKHLGQIDKKK